MPFISIVPELKRAQSEGYAIPLFDAVDMVSTEGMVLSAEAVRAPVIIALYDAVFEGPNARALASYIRTRAEKAAAPISLMLDHGKSFEQCIRALAYGFSDVMFDGSQLPLEENIATTRAIVKAAHAVGVGVEAELGHVGQGSQYQDTDSLRRGFTDPDEVERFVAETGVDFLAIAIGTAHGPYAGEPQLDLERLAAIRARVNVPLVLHGGSGLSEAQFRAAIAGGIAKVNVATDLFVTTARRMVEAARATEAVSYFALSKVATDSFEERCGYYLNLFGAAGKG
ncbi:MAG TPA: class II fructose-bisphosphate aldolase [Anaerolineae bacterium]|nr:class II fructose-bisphosphate aldolase [Anaerolineae bacterium]